MAIIDNVIDGIITINIEGTIESFNKSAEEIFQYSRDEAIGKSINMLLPEEHVYEHDRYIQDYQKSGKGKILGVGPRELGAKRKDGSIIPIELAISKMSFNNNTVFIGAIRDISERKKSQQKLEQYARQLKQNNIELDLALKEASEATRSKSYFLANMSHEIRTPMNGMLGMLGILKNTKLTPEQQEFIETASVSGESLLTIINDILDFSKVEAGKLDLEHSPYNIRKSLEDISTLLAESAHKKGVELALEITPTFPAIVQGDPTRLRQVVTNLMSNAIKFTEQGEVVVKAKVASETTSHVQICIDIIDTGIGIPTEQQTKVFSSFSQADGSTTRKYGGTGLGLSISQQLCQLMGGDLQFTSYHGKGSHFWATLELEKYKSGKNELHNFSDLEDSNLYALIVDDNKTNRRIMEHQLSHWNIRYDSAENGLDAIHMVSDADDNGTPYDFILMDMMMPNLDGLQTSKLITRMFREQRPKIIILTSMGTIPQAEKQEEKTIDSTLRKPVRQGLLLESIRGTLGLGAQLKTASESTELTPSIISDAKILLVEDHQINRRVAEVLLKNMGYSSLSFAENGVQALEAAKKNKFDVILMDCQMPEMDGLEATRQIRQLDGENGKTPIIAMTANAMSGDRENCLTAGMDDYIAKPIKPEELESRLLKWLNK